MATSPDYLRLATNAVAIISGKGLRQRPRSGIGRRYPHQAFAARSCQCGCARLPRRPTLDAAALMDTSLYGLLAPASAPLTLRPFWPPWPKASSGHEPGTYMAVSGRGESDCHATELKVLASAQGQRLVMLTFASCRRSTQDLVNAVEQLPFDLLILDGRLNVTYANAGAVRSSGATGRPARDECPELGARPTRCPSRYTSAHWKGAIYHDDAVELRRCRERRRATSRCVVQPLKERRGRRGLGWSCR